VTGDPVRSVDRSESATGRIDGTRSRHVSVRSEHDNKLKTTADREMDYGGNKEDAARGKT